MQDEVIRKALEVAAKALCFGHDGQDCDMCAAPEHCYKSHVFLRKDAAAAIAAFLRAMKPERGQCWVYEWITINRSINSMSAEKLATAIECAAGGEGEWKVTMTEVKKENN